MEARIITIHSMHNPGSVLQAYALQEYINRICSVQIIDYRPNYLLSENSSWKYILKRILFFYDYSRRAKRFNQFIHTNMNLTRTYNTYEELCNAQMEGDVYIVGSDQLWNPDFPCGHDSAYTLDFVKEKRKISYSTSIGKKEIDDETIKRLKRELKDFDYLSVREETTSLRLTKELNRDVQWVCDPVMLLSSDCYKCFITKRPINQPYVMVYLSESSELLTNIVDYYRSLGKKIVLVGGFTKRCYCDIHLKDAGPSEFLTYIFYADVVISSSFHATVFSLLFHKNFATIKPKGNGERIESILSLTGLKKRGLSDSSEIEIIDQKINWEKVDKALQGFIDNSKKYLQSALSTCEITENRICLSGKKQSFIQNYKCENAIRRI